MNRAPMGNQGRKACARGIDNAVFFKKKGKLITIAFA